MRSSDGLKILIEVLLSPAHILTHGRLLYQQQPEHGQGYKSLFTKYIFKLRTATLANPTTYHNEVKSLIWSLSEYMNIQKEIFRN